MYKYYYCKEINNNFYNSKISLDKLSYLIKKYDLEYKNYIKEYWINNLLIVSNNNDIKFYKIYDKDVKYQNEYIVKSYDIDECTPFNFNKTHSEEEYILYENVINDIKVVLKKFSEYITLEFESNNLINNNNFLCYNII
jgi:hypothetical protein